MSIKYLVPRWQHTAVPTVRQGRSGLTGFGHDVDRLFDAFFGTGLAPFGAREERGLDRFDPKVNVSETDKEVKVSAELPGLDEKDVTLEVTDSVLTIRGEKKEEREEEDGDWHYTEQHYGSFHRSVPLPESVDAGKAKARYRKGVLTIRFPKKPEEEARRKTIEIKAEA